MIATPLSPSRPHLAPAPSPDGGSLDRLMAGAVSTRRTIMAILIGLHYWPETIRWRGEMLDLDLEDEGVTIRGITIMQYRGRGDSKTLVERCHDGRLFEGP